MLKRVVKLLALALAALATFSSTAHAGANTMCHDDNDFVAADCEELSDSWLSKLPESSWGDVTCQSMKTTVAWQTDETVTVLDALGVHGFGATCCGSLGQTRCFDDTNMCKVASDFSGSVNLGDLGLSSPGSLCSSINTWLLLHQLDALSWDDVTCETMSTTSYTIDSGSRTVLEDLGSVGAACCGSLAKTRCFDGTNMCKVDADFNSAAIADSSEGTTCSDWSGYHLTQFGQTSWDDVKCSATYAYLLRSKPEISSCCGSLAKTRCVDGTNM